MEPREPHFRAGSKPRNVDPVGDGQLHPAALGAGVLGPAVERDDGEGREAREQPRRRGGARERGADDELLEPRSEAETARSSAAANAASASAAALLGPLLSGEELAQGVGGDGRVAIAAQGEEERERGLAGDCRGVSSVHPGRLWSRERPRDEREPPEARRGVVREGPADGEGQGHDRGDAGAA